LSDFDFSRLLISFEWHEIVRRVGMLFERADAIDREVEVAGRP
jgi:hypothetical protein